MNLFIFDLDGTLVRKNTSFHFYFHLLRKKKLPPKTLLATLPLYARYRAGISTAELHREVFEKVLKGRPLSLFTEEVESFLDLFLTPNLRLELLRESKGKMKWLFSNSPSFLVEAIAKKLSFDHWRGTEYLVDEQGILREISDLVDGKKKLSLAMESPFLKEQIVAYSDSQDDLPLLKWVGKVQVVNPDRALSKFAKKRGWEVFSK